MWWNLGLLFYLLKEDFFLSQDIKNLTNVYFAIWEL
jgi:hypothetical protein